MIVTVIGARPQFVKAAVVSKALLQEGIKEKIIHTGQHYDEKMSAVFWKEMGIPPCEINLDTGSGTHGSQTAKMLERIEAFLLANSSQVKAVLVYGDTNSTMAAALAASKLHIPVVHVESGLRSFNRQMPEEINRVVTDHISSVLFCPSEISVEQLKKEGITNQVYNSGDVMYDALLEFSSIAEAAVNIKILEKYRNTILLTIHRPSNTDDLVNLRSIIDAVKTSPENFVWPVHPRTRSILQKGDIDLPANLSVCEPFSYFEMLYVLKHSKKVMTDSGGLQKEAYWMQKPCITLREETEWEETLQHNWNILTGPRQLAITAALEQVPDAKSWTPLYGNGKAAVFIAQKLKALLY